MVSMKTALITHRDCALHRPPDRHPESPARLAAVLEALSGEGFEDLDHIEAVPALQSHLLRVHPQSHLDTVHAAIPAEGYTFLDEDTVLSPTSLHPAMLSAGAAIQAVDIVVSGAASRGTQHVFCATRPPGHHAEPEQAMGFCFFSNAAIAARHAQAEHGLQRVAVVDFDVHHGNGTQAAFMSDASLFYASTHQHPLYPGTGDAGTTGIAHNILNAPLPPHTNGEIFRSTYETQIFPALNAFAPNLLIVSAGFDGHRRDPLAQMDLEDEDYAWVTRHLCDTANRHCEGRLVSLLEGGYDLDALASASRAHVAALMAN